MKRLKFSFLTILVASSSVFAAQNNTKYLEDTNPFDENAKPNIMTEPSGLVSYSFKKNSNSIVNIDPDRGYLFEAQQTKMFGRVHTHPSRVTNLKSEIQDRISFQAERKENFKKRQLKTGLVSFESAEIMFEKTMQGKLPSLTHILPSLKPAVTYGAGNYITNKGWDTSVSIIRNKQLGNIIIELWNYEATNGGVILDSDAVNISIMGNPGVFIVRTAGDNSESVLSWADEKSAYTIRSDADLGSGELRSKLIELADLITIENSNGEY